VEGEQENAGSDSTSTPTAEQMAAEFAASQEQAQEVSADPAVSANAENAATAESQTQAPTDWTAQPLPENHPGRAKGFQTWGDVHKSYEASSQEGHRLNADLRAAQERSQAYEFLLKRAMQTGQAPAQANKPTFDVAEFQRIAAVDPMKAIQLAAVHGIKQDPNALKGLLQPYEQKLAEIEQHNQSEMFNRKMQADFAELQSKYKDTLGNPQSAEFQAADKYWNENSWVKDLGEAYPQVNAQEVAYKLATYDLIAQKLKAQDVKLVDKRAKSATVKPGSVAPASHAGTSAARAAAADLAAQGISIPEDWQREMDIALRRA
jgi:hypothetical protein